MCKLPASAHHIHAIDVAGQGRRPHGESRLHNDGIEIKLMHKQSGH
jgi:hypothetical protein